MSIDVREAAITLADRFDECADDGDLEVVLDALSFRWKVEARRTLLGEEVVLLWRGDDLKWSEVARADEWHLGVLIATAASAEARP